MSGEHKISYPTPRESDPKLWEEELRYVKEYFEVEFKSVGYLLTANAAGLAGCMTLLKDYSTTPELKGLGLFISMFGAGFLSAVIGFITVTMHRQAWIRVFFGEPSSKKVAQMHAIGAAIPNAISCLLLTGAIAAMIGRFFSL
jgi:hypothetical protein